ncbi:hypothetical protein D3C73_1444600 [compost metagenome]
MAVLQFDRQEIRDAIDRVVRRTFQMDFGTFTSLFAKLPACDDFRGTLSEVAQYWD